MGKQINRAIRSKRGILKTSPLTPDIFKDWIRKNFKKPKQRKQHQLNKLDVLLYLVTVTNDFGKPNWAELTFNGKQTEVKLEQIRPLPVRICGSLIQTTYTSVK